MTTLIEDWKLWEELKKGEEKWWGGKERNEPVKEKGTTK